MALFNSMSKKEKLVIGITLISLLFLVILRPIIPAFFGMKLYIQILYLIVMYGFPILLFLPVAILVLPIVFFAKKDRVFKEVWLKYSLTAFIPISVLILAINGMLVGAKYFSDFDPFPLKKYDDVIGYEGDVSDLKTGKFELYNVRITRYPDYQVEVYENGDVKEFDVIWLSNNEYQLIIRDGSYLMNDTLNVKISDNTPDYYEVYLKYGDYTQNYKMIKTDF